MRALVLDRPGNPPALRIEERPIPTPGPGQALVRVATCGFCHHDRLVMAGRLRRGVKPGIVLGHEIAGVVEALGPPPAAAASPESGRAAVAISPESASPDAADIPPPGAEIRPGDRVVSLLTEACGRCPRCAAGLQHRCPNGLGIGHGRDGGFAEFVCISTAALVKLPADADLVASCLLACPMSVALQAVEGVAQLRAGETALITGAGGGLGVHAVQLAAALGARTLAVTSSPEKAERLAEYGAAEVLLLDDALDFAEVCLALTGEAGADVVIDTVGAAVFDSCLRALAQFGRLTLLGELGGGRAELRLAELIFRDARILGASGASRPAVERARDLTAAGTLRPILQQTLPLEEAATAYEMLAHRAVFGRLALVFN